MDPPVISRTLTRADRKHPSAVSCIPGTFNHRGRIVADGLGVLFTTILQDPLLLRQEKRRQVRNKCSNVVEKRYMLPDKEKVEHPSLLTRPSSVEAQRVGALLAFEKA
jgi:hypothetical protein